MRSRRSLSAARPAARPLASSITSSKKRIVKETGSSREI
jgi:hypothetical protein